MAWNPDEYQGAAEEVLETLASAEAEEQQEIQAADEVLSNAMQRIEEANLFKLLIKDSVFKAGSASPEILISVNKKIRLFALEQLEELLGMKTKAQPAEPIIQQVKSDFDKEELMVLKVLVNKALRRDKPISLTEERKPELQTIAPATHTNTAPSLQPVGQQRPLNLPKQAATALQQKQQVAKKATRPGRTPAKTGAGYARPSQQALPLPTAEQLIGTLGGGQSPTFTDSSQASAGSSNLVQTLVQQLTGGNILASSNQTNTEQEDINGRF